MTNIIVGDCLVELAKIPGETFHLCVTDPPWNIGFKYNQYKDNLGKKEYVGWCSKWLTEIFRALKDDGSFFLFIGPKFVSELDVLCKEIGFHQRNHLIWSFNFGNYAPTKFSNCHSHILYFTKHEKNFTFNGEAIKVPSLRQTKYKDKRATKGGKVPGDVLSFPRVCGTFKRRAKGHPCQIPEEITNMIILSCSNKGDSVLDPFAGSFTTGVSCVRYARNFTGVELSSDYAKIGEARLTSTKCIV